MDNESHYRKKTEIKVPGIFKVPLKNHNNTNYIGEIMIGIPG
jgi:hypothetical protein